MTKTLIVLAVLCASFSLASPASADQTAHHADDPITALAWVNSGNYFGNKDACNVYGAAGVAKGWWSNWDCRYEWWYFRYALWVRTG